MESQERHFRSLPGTWQHISKILMIFLSDGMLETSFATPLLLNSGPLKLLGCLENLLYFDEITGGWNF